MMAAGRALKCLQSYQIADTTAISKHSGRTGHTTLSPHKALHFVKVLLQELQLYSRQVSVASNWEIGESTGCAPDPRFCRALVYLQHAQEGPRKADLSQQLPGMVADFSGNCPNWQVHPAAVRTLLLPQSPRQQRRAPTLTGPAIYGFSFRALIMTC